MKKLSHAELALNPPRRPAGYGSGKDSGADTQTE